MIHSKQEQDDGNISLIPEDYNSYIFYRTLGGCLQESTHCYTLEVSFFSYQTSSTIQAIPYTEDLCKLETNGEISLLRS